MDSYQDMRHLYYSKQYSQEELKNLLLSRYQGEATIRLPFQIGEHPAFVMLPIELHSLISAIYQANSKLERLCASMPQSAIRHFQNGMMVEEIQQSNEVENVRSTRKEIREALLEMQEGRREKRFAGMVRKYEMMLTNKDIPLRSCSDVRNLYDEFLLDEVLREDPSNAPDGVFFRQGPVQVGSKTGKNLHDGLLPEKKIIETLDQALSFLNDSDCDPLIRVAVFHYAFAYIHPFYDGNGRMTRFISCYMLSKFFDKSACLRISYVIKEHLGTYYRIFKDANSKQAMGEVTGFVWQFLQFFKEAIEYSIRSLVEKKIRYEHYDAMLQNAVKQMNLKLPEHQQHFLNVMLQAELFGVPYFTTGIMANVLNCSDQTIRSFMKKCGVLVYHTNDRRAFVWRMNLKELERLARQDE